MGKPRKQRPKKDMQHDSGAGTRDLSGPEFQVGSLNPPQICESTLVKGEISEASDSPSVEELFVKSSKVSDEHQAHNSTLVNIEVEVTALKSTDIDGEIASNVDSNTENTFKSIADPIDGSDNAFSDLLLRLKEGISDTDFQPLIPHTEPPDSENASVIEFALSASNDLPEFLVSKPEESPQSMSEEHIPRMSQELEEVHPEGPLNDSSEPKVDLGSNLPRLDTTLKDISNLTVDFSSEFTPIIGAEQLLQMGDQSYHSPDKNDLEKIANENIDISPLEPGKNTLSNDPVDLKSSSLMLPAGWSLCKLEVELPLAPAQKITCVSSHDSNLYIGTSRGQILHLFLFDDAEQYILITQMAISDSMQDEITKILVVPDAEMCLVLAGKIVYFFTLPELSPCRIGKVKDAEDVLLMSAGKLPSDRNKSDKIIVYTLSKLRVLHVLKTGVKLLKDINYSGAILGLSSATGTLAHYSNICLVANEKRYDVVDMQQARKIALFEYNAACVQDAHPYIVAYHAGDIVNLHEEYLLPVCTEDASSMAMFVNSAGDVTRGTLTWIDEGYPYHGLVVDWPYVIGIFRNPTNAGSKLIVSSLTSLGVVFSVPCENLSTEKSGPLSFLRIVKSDKEIKVVEEELLGLLAMVSCVSREPVNHQKQSGTTRTVLSDGRLLYYLRQRNELAAQLSELYELIRDPGTLLAANEDALELLFKKQLRYFDCSANSFPQNNDFHYRVFLVLLLFTRNFSELKRHILEHPGVIDPRLLMFFCAEKTQIKDEFWEVFNLERFFLDLRDHAPDHMTPNLHNDFYVWLIREVFAHKDAYNDVISHAAIRRLHYMETCHTSSEVLEVIDSEPDLWVGQNNVSDELVRCFEEARMFLVVIHVYSMRQDAGNTLADWPLKIIDLCLNLIGGHLVDCETILKHDLKLDVITIGTHTFDLPHIAFRKLRDNVENEAIYTKKLLALLQLRPERGLAFMKAVKGAKFASTHKLILNELSKSYTFDSKFLLLKIEYTELFFLQSSKTRKKIDLDVATELFHDYMEYLNQAGFEVEYENLTILYNTYALENDLKSAIWPKVMWIEYLHLHYKKGVCEEFLTVYLKVYEVLVLHAMFGRALDFDTVQDNAALTFLKWIRDADDASTQDRLHAIGDYSTAEWLVFYPFPPVPRTLIVLSSFLAEDPKHDLLVFQKRPDDEIRAKLVRLIETYLALEDKLARYTSVLHAINIYAGPQLQIGDILKLLPHNFPLMYVEQYFTSEVVKLNMRRSDSHMQKALHKANAKLYSTVVKNFEEAAKVIASSSE